MYVICGISGQLKDAAISTPAPHTVPGSGKVSQTLASWMRAEGAIDLSFSLPNTMVLVDVPSLAGCLRNRGVSFA
jgi:hypothetical protein